jgi:hypothetical protein
LPPERSFGFATFEVARAEVLAVLFRGLVAAAGDLGVLLVIGSAPSIPEAPILAASRFRGVPSGLFLSLFDMRIIEPR